MEKKRKRKKKNGEWNFPSDSFSPEARVKWTHRFTGTLKPFMALAHPNSGLWPFWITVSLLIKVCTIFLSLSLSFSGFWFNNLLQLDLDLPSTEFK